ILNIPRGLLEHIERHAVLRCPSCARVIEESSAERAAACPGCGAAALEQDEAWSWLIDTREAASHLETLVDSGEHLLSVVNRVLDLSSLESGRMTADVQRVDVSELFARMAESMRVVAARKHIELT